MPRCWIIRSSEALAIVGFALAVLVAGACTDHSGEVEIDIDPVSSRGVAVAINEEIVRRPDWTTRQLESGDEVELVTAQQGG